MNGSIGEAVLPSILITRRVFPEVVTWLKQHCEVEYRDDDSTIDPHELAERAMNKQAHAGRS